MISSTSNTDRVVRTELPAVAGPAGRPRATMRPDQFSNESTVRLRAALDQQPAVRPDVVARARALANDPDYPSAATIRHVAAQILAAPDLTEIGS